MAWEGRRNGKRYYYRSRRGLNGRVVKEYCGGGPRGEAAAQADAERRAARAQEREAEQQRRHAYELSHERLIDLDAGARAIIAEGMTAAGYHRHDRGPWRKQHERTHRASRS